MLRNRFSAILLGLCGLFSCTAAQAHSVSTSGGSALVGASTSGSVVYSFDAQGSNPSPFALIGMEFDVGFDSSKLALDLAASTVSYSGTTSVYPTASSAVALTQFFDSNASLPFDGVGSYSGLASGNFVGIWTANLFAPPYAEIDGQTVSFNLVFNILAAGTSTVNVSSSWADDNSTSPDPLYLPGPLGTSASFDVTGTQLNTVPEPAVLLLLGTVALAAGLRRRQIA